MEKNSHTFTVAVAVVSMLVVGVGVYIWDHKTVEAPSLPPEKAADVGEVSSILPDVLDTSAPKMAITPSVPSKVKVANTALVGRKAPELKLPSGFTNTDPILMKDFIGKKVVLVTFWTNSSVNAMRTIPYLNQWHLKYKDKGLVVLSIHTPRFTFERDKDNVDKAAFVHNMIHPIMLDNQYATWNAWGNTDWPSQYLVDINGNIVYTHRGEGDYQAMEAKIDEQLTLRAKKLKLPVETYAAFEAPAGIEPVDLTRVKSAEVYFGSLRNSTLGNGTPLKAGIQDMKPFTSVIGNTLYLSGSWDISGEYAKSAVENDRVTFRYSAKNVYAVFGALKMNKVRITLDGQPLGANGGKDVRIEGGQSYLYVTEERVYDIVKGLDYGEHTLELVAETSGLLVYDLMFG